MNNAFGRFGYLCKGTLGRLTVVFGLCALALPSAQTAAAQAAPVLLPWTMTTIAGDGSNGLPTNGQPAIDSSLSTSMRGVAVDGQGNVFIADETNSLIEEVNAATGLLRIVAGGGNSNNLCAAAIDKEGDNCPATQAALSSPRGIAVDREGNIYIAGYGDYLVHKINIQTGLMTVVAGAPGGNYKTGNTKGYTGDGGAANQAALNQPRGVAVDAQGNVWIADTGNNVIREVTAATGKISTVVGYNTSGNNSAETATTGYTGQGVAANTAELNEPVSLSFDEAGNLYIADYNNVAIRMVAATGGSVTGSSLISTVIGTLPGGTAPTKPTSTPTFPQAATSAYFAHLTSVAADSSGNLYVADTGENVVYFYDATTQTVTPVAGQWGYSTSATGYSVCGNATDSLGDSCPATQAFLNGSSSILGVALDAQDNLYITDPGDARIREASSDLAFPATALGTGATQTIEVHFAKNDTPAATNGIALGASAGDFTLGTPACTVASDSTDDCTVSVTFNGLYPGLRTAPVAITSAESETNLYALSGIGIGALQSVDPGTLSTLGSGLASPQGGAFDALGNLYIADTANNRVIEINASTQAQTVFAGTGTAGYSGDHSAAASATLNAPEAVAVAPNGTIYIADTGNNVIRAVNAQTGIITTYAGGGTACSYHVDTQGDGCPAINATLNAPAGVAVGTNNDLYIADTGDSTIRRIDFNTGYINLHAGTAAGVTCSSPTDKYGDGCPLVSSSTSFSGPTGLAIDANGNVFVADTGDGIIRELNAGTGLVTVSAGNGQSAFTGDGGPANQAALNDPTAVAIDAAEDVYIADTGNAVVRVVSGATGDISTLLGDGGFPGSSGGTGAVSQLLLTNPRGLAVAPQGGLFVADTGNSRGIADNRNSALLAFGVSNVGATSPEQTATLSDLGNAALTFTASPFYSATDATDFPIDTSATTACSGGGTINAGADCTLAAAFDPTAINAFSSTLTFASNAANQGFASLLLTGKGVVLALTTTALAQTSPTGALTYGQQATFTATVAPNSGTGTPTGTITFSVDGVQRPAVALSSADQATLSVNLAVGTHTVTAIYNGDDTYASSNTSLSVPVSQAATTTTLNISPATQIQLQPVTFTANVASTTTGTPTGSVNFVAGGTVLGTGTLTAQGVATFTSSSLSIAGYSVTAVYSGDPNYAASTSSASSLTISAIPAGISATASPATLSTPQGGQVQTTLYITPQGPLTGTVTLSCSGLPANSNCTFYPTTLNLGGTPTAVPNCTVPSSASASTVCTTLTITTNLPPASVQARAVSDRHGAPMALAILFPALIFGFGGIFAGRKRSIPWMVVLGVVALAGLTALSGCSTNNVTQQTGQATPTGTSTVTVTLTGSGNVTLTIPLTLNVLSPTSITAEAKPLPRLDLTTALVANALAVNSNFTTARILR